MQEELAAFTLRIPYSLHEQIKARARVNRRTKNGEINVLLETAIDSSVNSDLEVLKKTAGQSQI